MSEISFITTSITQNITDTQKDKKEIGATPKEGIKKNKISILFAKKIPEKETGISTVFDFAVKNENKYVDKKFESTARVKVSPGEKKEIEKIVNAIKYKKSKYGEIDLNKILKLGNKLTKICDENKFKGEVTEYYWALVGNQLLGSVKR